MKHKRISTHALSCGAVMFTLSVGVAAWAQDQPTLDDLLNITPDKPADDGQGDGTGTAPIDPDLSDLIDQAQGIGDNLQQAMREMNQASARLVDASDPGLDTQRLQESVLRRLDMVIAEAKKQQQQSSSSSSGGGQSQSEGGGQPQDTGSGQNAGQNQSGNPQNGQQQNNQQNQGDPGQSSDSDPNRIDNSDPNINPGDPLAESRKEWGNLPQRVRDELLQGLSERFSPVYREMTEAYYKRLAEEAGSQ